MKKILLLLLLLLSIGIGDIQGQDFSYEGLWYTVISESEKTVKTREGNNDTPGNPISGDLVLPETVYDGETAYKLVEIGYQAFYGCSGLTSVEIPNSVTSIGSYAFLGCSGLTRVDISDLSAWCNIEFGNVYANPLYYANRLYLNNEEIINLEIPDGVSSIKNYAFYGCSGPTSVEIPNSVTSIGDYAFLGCSGLTSIEIPNSVTSIGDFAFRGCSRLTSVEIPNSVISIGYSAFSGCSGLTSVVIPNSVTSIGGYAFNGCSEVTALYIGESVKSIGSKAFASSQLLEEVVCAAVVPPTGDKDIFSDFTYTYATLFVPERSLNSYKNLAPWSNFFSIKNLEQSGVDEIGMADSEILYDVFNLNGQLVMRQASQSDIDALVPGIYIIGGKKVFVK